MSAGPPDGSIERLHALPRLRLGIEPTPLEEAPRLAEALGEGSTRVLVKRDDWTGFGLGGNKVRKLEMELAPERTEGIDVLVTAGGVQSNHARVTAAAAARLGKRCILVLSGEPPDPPRGNALLHRLFGAEIVMVERGEERSAGMARVAEEAHDRGQNALVIPIGASTPLGALGYARAALEADDQLAGAGSGSRTWIFVASGSCGTLAGLALGFRLAGRDDVRLVGVSDGEPREGILRTTEELATGAAALLGWNDARGLTDRVRATDAFAGEGYGIASREGDVATRLFARRAGIVLDPVYTAKAAAGMIDWIRKGRVSSGETVIFWHTGGHPALFRE